MNSLLQFFAFLKDIWRSRELIFELTKKDFQVRYLGSFLGILWAFIQPTVSILIFWFVFQVGFKAAPIDNIPFILWLISGMLPWFFFSDALSSATMTIVESSYLVKKVVFRVSILPIIKILAALFVHAFFIGLMLAMFMFYGYVPTLYAVQLLYYIFASIVLLLGLTWITSSLVIFLKDVGQIVGMLLQFGFWLTPIFWSIKSIPIEYREVLQMNPLYYIVEGYRNSMIYHRWFWEDPLLTVWFWVITLIIFVLGAMLFRRLRPHFADVL